VESRDASGCMIEKIAGRSRDGKIGKNLFSRGRAYLEKMVRAKSPFGFGTRINKNERINGLNLEEGPRFTGEKKIGGAEGRFHPILPPEKRQIK